MSTSLKHSPAKHRLA